MEFRILGPLEVAVDGDPVALGGPKPRALLAALLLRPGVVVSKDRLVTAVWGADPPRDAVGVLRTYASRLRTVLPPERLRYRAPGYVLSVGDGELDSAVFAELVARAGERAAVADHAQAVELLDAARALWRGEPLAEFDAADVDADSELARLADLRLVAAEERADALSRLGRGRDVVAELEGLVRAYPERERLSALLMRALYATGRQGDALAVYRELRALLVDKLGVEPAESTRAVHRQLLAQDPQLLPVAGPPTNLPRRATTFVNRTAEIAQLTAAVRSAPLVTLSGVGGVGKSRLALEVAARALPGFPDGAWLVELAPLPDGGPVGQAVAAALGVRQAERATVEESVVEYLRGRRLLLVLDNCEHVLEPAARLVDALVASCPGVVVLATSWAALGVPGEQIRLVSPLPADDAATLFLARARASRPDFDPVVDGTGAVAEICRLLDGLPLGIELAAARMGAMSAAEVAARLSAADVDARLLARGPRTVQPRHQSLVAAIDWSYRLLSEAEQRMFARMSVFAGGADLEGVHEVCTEPGATEADTLELVTALVDKSMVVAAAGPVGTRYSMLYTLRAYGREHLPPDESVDRRHAEHVVCTARRAAAEVQGPDERAAVERLLPETANLRAAFEWLHAQGDVDLALALVAALPEVLQVRLGFETAGWAEQALDLAAPEHPLFVAAVGTAARGAWNFGDFARARRLAARAGDRRPGAGAARTSYPADVAADVALYSGDVEAALAHYTGEVVAARAADDPVRLVWTLYYVAVCHAVRRTPELGVPAAEESLKIADATANPTAMSIGRYALGLVLKKSEADRALTLLDEAARLAASVHNFWWQGIAMMEAAATRAAHGDPTEAARESVAVLDHWERLGDRTQQWLNVRYLVRLLVRLGAVDDALVLHHHLLAEGKSSPLDAARADELVDGPRARAAVLRGAGLSAVDAVALARRSLARHV